MRKRIPYTLSVLALCLTLLSTAAWATDDKPYIDGTGSNASVSSYTLINQDSADLSWGSGWYVVEGTPTISGNLTITGDVNLILCDGAELTVTGGIVCNASLTIYGQTSGTGKLTTVNGYYDSSLASYYGIKMGEYNLTINGGIITAKTQAVTDANLPNGTKRVTTYGICCWGSGGHGSFAVNRGTVTATGGDVTQTDAVGRSYGIYLYSSSSDGTMTIGQLAAVTATGGKVTVTLTDTFDYQNILHNYGSPGSPYFYYIYNYGLNIDNASLQLAGTLNATGGDIAVSAPADKSYTINGLNCGVSAGSGSDSNPNRISGTLTATSGDVTADSSSSTGVALGRTTEINGVTLTATAGSSQYGSDFSLGTLTLSTGAALRSSRTGGAVVMNASYLTVSGGSIALDAGSDLYQVSVTGESTLAGLLADGCAYYDQYSKEQIILTDQTSLSQVNVKKPCNPHVDADGNGFCDVCGAVSYVDSTGATAYQEVYTLLNSSYVNDYYYWNFPVQLYPSNSDSTCWYVVKEDLTISNTVLLYNNVNLILCDGATLTVTGGIDYNSTYGGNATLTIYGQSGGTGKLTASTGPDNYYISYMLLGGNSFADIADYVLGHEDGIRCYDLTIYGGTVTATGVVIDDSNRSYITGSHGVRVTHNLTVNGGKLVAGSTDGMALCAANAITLGTGMQISQPTGGSITQLTANSASYYTVTEQGSQTPSTAVTIEKGSSGDGGSGSTPPAYVPVYPTSYPIAAPGAANGTVTVSPASAAAGTTVTITVTPDSGYAPGGLTVLDKNGNSIPLTDRGNGQYTFIMPAGQVTVTAIFTPLRQFVDVPAGMYCYDAVQWAVGRGITSGVDESHFGPDLSCTRAQLVTFLWRAAGCPVVDYAMNFADVDENAYYAEAIRWAASLGIVDGYGSGLFGTGDDITREQVVVILYRFAVKVLGVDAVTMQELLSGYGDAGQVTAYAVPAMNWALANGIMQGADGSLMPGQPCTRGQIVTMLHRLLGK